MANLALKSDRSGSKPKYVERSTAEHLRHIHRLVKEAEKGLTINTSGMSKDDFLKLITRR